VLHKMNKLRGFRIHATDGEIGHVEEFLLDGATWGVRYLVVDTGNWIGGRSVLISSTVVEKIDAPNEQVFVRLTRGQIEHSPSVDTAEIELVETLPSVWIL
jgi:hypothetical protein